MSAVLACDPDGLEASAQGLRRAAAELGSTADEVRAAGDAGWSGLASLEQAARRREVADAVRDLGSPLEEVAAALGEVAAAAREQGGLVRRQSVVRDERVLERHRLLALGPPPEPVAAAHWRSVMALLEEEVERLERSIAAAEEQFGRVLHRAAQILSRLLDLVPRIVWDLGVLAVTAKKAVDGGKQVASAGAVVASLRGLRRMQVRGGERTLHRTRERVEKNLRRLRKAPPGWVSKVPGGAAIAGRAVPVVAGVTAAPDVWRGGGYEGWRAGLTRVLAGGAVVGVGVALFVPAGAAAGVVGMGAAVVYQGWMTGNWVYDNRDRIRSAASRVWARTRGVGGQVLSDGRRLLGRARKRATSGLDRLRGRRDELRHPPRRQGTDPVAPGVAPTGVSA